MEHILELCDDESCSQVAVPVIRGGGAEPAGPPSENEVQKFKVSQAAFK